MKYLKWFAFGSSCLGVAIFVPAFASIGQPILAFCAAGGFATLTWFFWHLLPETNHYRQPMATAKSGGWEPPRNWNHRPDGMKRPEPPPGPPTRYIDEGVRIWPDSDNHATWGPRSIKRLLQMEKQDLDRRAKSLSNFIGLSEAFDRLDPVEQDLLRHQCEHMWSYSEVLGARIANWRDGGGK